MFLSRQKKDDEREELKERRGAQKGKEVCCGTDAGLVYYIYRWMDGWIDR